MPHTTSGGARRRGKARTFTIDYDSDTLLRQMVQRTTGYGSFVSELIRKEYRERQQRVPLTPLASAQGEQ
jgi:hypothetical protein